LLLLSFVFFVNFMGRIVLAPLLPAIEQDLGLSHAQSGFLFFTLSAGYCAALLCSGFVSARLTHRRTIILSMTCLGIALLATAFSPGIGLLRLGLLAAGMSAGLYLPSAMSAIMEFLPTRHWGKGIAVHEAAPNLSFVLAPLVCEAMLAVVSWTSVLIVFGIAALLAAGVFAVWGRFGDFRGQAPNLPSVRAILAGRTYWRLVLVFGLAIGASLGIYAILPLFLVSGHGLEREHANTLAALTRIPGVAAAFGSGWFTDRFGPKRTMAGVLLLNGLLTIGLGAVPMPWLLLPVCVQPALSVCFFPAGFSAIGLSVPANARNLAIALTTPMAFIIGAGVVPSIIGLAGDVWSFSGGLFVTGGLILAGAALARRLHFFAAGDKAVPI
jgi:NNP family nitrate/nitrite transporter-like MFS transporter